MAEKHYLVNEAELKEIIITEIKNLIDSLNSEDFLFTQTEAANFLKISVPTLIEWRTKKIVPFIQIGRKILFKRHELLNISKKIIA